MKRERATDQTATRAAELSWERLDRLDWHLWVLATLLIFVLGASLLSFMFPSAFWSGEQPVVERSQRAFFGFCVLLALVLVYLLQRQATVRQLKRQLFEAQAVTAEAKRETTIQAFQTLPTLSQFQDTLAMEYRRASTSGAHLAVLLLTAPNAFLETLGHMASLLRSLLRQGESLYRISDKSLGIILPGMPLSQAAGFAAQAEERIGIPKGELVITLTAYPEESGTLTELEQRLRGHAENFCSGLALTQGDKS